MMKRSYVFLFVALFSLFMQPICHAAITDWVKQKAQQAREAAHTKFVEAQQALDKLQQTLQSNANCILEGNCAPGQRELIIGLTKRVGIEIAALIVVGGVAAIAAKAGVFEQEEKPLTISSPTATKDTISIQELASKFGIKSVPQDDSLPARFIGAVRNKVLSTVEKITDLVNNSFLQLGKAIASRQQAITKDTKERQAYQAIERTIDKGLQTYNESTLQRNLQFIYAASTGLLEEVKQRICDISLTPSRNAMNEAQEQIKAKITNPTFKGITEFIQKPTCNK